MDSLFQPLSFAHGPAMKNRFMLAPLTNTQSDDDGCLSDMEYKWLVMRAQGGFGMTMTCAANVQLNGRGFSGQLGIFSEAHEEGLTRLASGIREEDSLAVVQLYHAGMRSPADLIGGQPICPSDNEETGARAMSTAEVKELIENFVSAAQRAQRCGYDGVQIHGAHGYILSQFLSAEINHRIDEYGGSLENRARPTFEILDQIRQRCGSDFNVGLRLSPERFGLNLEECLEVAKRAMNSQVIDYLDMSLWDVAKEPKEEQWQGRSLRSYFLELDRGNTRLGIAGRIATADLARQCIDEGFDYIALGRAAILHHDFPKRCTEQRDFAARAFPVTREYLRSEGVGDRFADYLAGWKGLVAES